MKLDHPSFALSGVMRSSVLVSRRSWARRMVLRLRSSGVGEGEVSRWSGWVKDDHPSMPRGGAVSWRRCCGGS